MPPQIRKASEADLPLLAGLYDQIHTAEEAGFLTTGWIRDVYPVLETGVKAQAKGELFLLVQDNILKGAAIINQDQHPAYKDGNWQFGGNPAEIMVMHTLAIAPQYAGQGLGSAFLRFYAEYAHAGGCPVLRLDTNAKNLAARKFYNKAGFLEAGTVKTPFNGIEDVDLVLLENLTARVLCV